VWLTILAEEQYLHSIVGAQIDAEQAEGTGLPLACGDGASVIIMKPL
jgi:hypothetical protein